MYMSDTKEVFFSDINVKKVCKHIMIFFDDKSPEFQKACELLLSKNVMPIIFKEHSKRIKSHPVDKSVPYLNKKSYNMCLEIIKKELDKKSNDFDGDIKTKKPNKSVEKPSRKEKNNDNDDNTIGAMNGDFGGYAPFSVDNINKEQFITASGQIGRSMSQITESFDDKRKKDYTSDISKRYEDLVTQRQSERQMINFW
jgi:hypothetical protein